MLAGILEIDPTFAWQQQVVAGVGVAEDVKVLYNDMHSYLAGRLLRLCFHRCTVVLPSASAMFLRGHRRVCCHLSMSAAVERQCMTSEPLCDQSILRKTGYCLSCWM